MPHKLIRDINQKAWNELKKMAIDCGVSLTEMIEIIIKYYREKNK
jgi:hypothetical protein